MLVFGTPLAGFGLQPGLVQQFELGTAFSALAFAALYLVTAMVLVRRALVNHRLLIALPALLLAWWLRKPQAHGGSAGAKVYAGVEAQLSSLVYLYGFACWCVAGARHLRGAGARLACPIG